MLVSAKKDERDDLFRQKCKICRQKCDFGNRQLVMAKEDTLHEILTTLKIESIQFANNIENWNAVISMIAFHIFRTPDPIPPEWFGFLDFYCLTDVIHEESWVHNSIIYDIAIEWIKRMKVDSKEKFILAGDLVKLCVFLCRTTDDREQEKLALLFSAIYEHVPRIRSFAWDVVSLALTRILHDDEPFTSAKPILKAMSGIIAGLKKPLNEKYLPFWHEVLLPLHRCEYMTYFAQELFICVAQMLEKEHSLVIDVYKTLVKYWPRLQPPKQMLFIDEIAYFSSFIDEECIEQCIRIVFPQLLRSLTSCHAPISEKILSMWEINDFVWLVTMSPSITYPMIIPKLLETGKTYWHPEMRILSAAVLNTMQLNDKRYFTAVGTNMKKIVSLDIMKGMTRAAKWKYLITTFEEDHRRKRRQLQTLSMLFDGCELIAAT